MARHKNLPAVTFAAGLAGQAIARLETEAKRIYAAESARRLQLVSANDHFSLLIKRGKTTVQIDGDDFAISHSE